MKTRSIKPKGLKKTKTARVKAVKAPKEPKVKDGKCAFIDGLYDGSFTRLEIWEHAMKKFPDADEKKMWANVTVRPYHIRKAGGKPAWKKAPRSESRPPFAMKEKATAGKE